MFIRTSLKAQIEISKHVMLPSSRKYISRLENRMRFALYNITRCYLWYETSRCHLRHSRFDECCACARKCVEGFTKVYIIKLFLKNYIPEAKLCGNNVWVFLGLLQMCKSHATLHKIERVNEALLEIQELVPKLNSSRLTEFINECLNINKIEIQEKKESMLSSTASAKSRKSKTKFSSSMESIFSMQRDDHSKKKISNKRLKK